jgi:hypothetical protein
MSRPRRPPVQTQDLQGFRYLRHFGELWRPLHACALDRAGNGSATPSGEPRQERKKLILTSNSSAEHY